MHKLYIEEYLYLKNSLTRFTVNEHYTPSIEIFPDNISNIPGETNLCVARDYVRENLQIHLAL